jgi:hypothetical protein
MNKTRLSFILLAACAGTPVSPTNNEQAPFAVSSDAIVDVQQTPAKRQSIGNCWIYATASWAESLHKQQTGEDVNLSESYWTFWHWNDQVLQGWSNEIETGGSFYTATEIIRAYGYMVEGDFIAEESTEIRSARQASALAAMNASLKDGALASSEARQNRALVFAEMTKAWQLAPEVVATLQSVFGDGSRNFQNGAVAKGTTIKNADDLAVVKPSPTRTAGSPTLTASTLTAATSDWTESSYPSNAARRRTFLQRVQRALHDRQPVILTWFVDFNSLDSQGRFLAPPATPGRQGGHMVVMEDYQASNVPGFGTLPVGVEVSDPSELDAALATEARIDLIRIKNSWGVNGTVPNMPGHHDLYIEYLNGPVKRCSESNPTSCFDTVPFTAAAFPPGY